MILMSIMGWLALAGFMAHHRRVVKSLKAEIRRYRKVAKRSRTTKNKRSNARKKKHKLIAKRGPRCEYCHTEFPAEQLTVDHYKPLSKGGNSHQENLRLACSNCNAAKGNKPAALWIQTIKEIKFTNNPQVTGKVTDKIV